MTRTRSLVTDGSTIPASYTNELVSVSGYCPGANRSVATTTSTINQGSLLSSTETMVMEDVVTPNFKAISARGGIINSPMTKTITTLKEPPIGFRSRYEVFSYCVGNPGKFFSSSRTLEGNVTFAFASLPLSTVGKYPTLADFTADEVKAGGDIAVTEAWANIDHTDVMSLVILAESGKTVNGLVDILKKVYNVVRKLRKLQFKVLLRDMRRSKEYIDLYLQARYGLRPLYYDAIGVVQAAKRLAPIVGSRETFRGNHTMHKEVTTNSSFNSSYGSYGGTTIPCLRISKTSIDYSFRAGVLTQFKGSPPNLSFGLQSIPESMWELVPFSFIVDWFANCGKTISSWTPNVESKTLASWLTTLKTVTQTSTLLAGEPNYVQTAYNQSEARNCELQFEGVHEKIVLTKTRTPNPSRSILPHFDVNLDPLKILDLVLITDNLLKISSQLKKPKLRF